MLHMKEITMYVCRKVRSLERALEAAFYAFFGELSGDRDQSCGSYRESLLRKKLEGKERDVKYLQFQLAKARADISELRQLRTSAAEVFAEVLSRNDEQLRKFPAHIVRETAEKTAWEVVTAHCCLGGCDLDAYTFPTERDARLYSALLKAVGYHTPNNRACPACYAEYMKDCI